MQGEKIQTAMKISTKTVYCAIRNICQPSVGCVSSIKYFACVFIFSHWLLLANTNPYELSSSTHTTHILLCSFWYGGCVSAHVFFSCFVVGWFVSASSIRFNVFVLTGHKGKITIRRLVMVYSKPERTYSDTKSFAYNESLTEKSYSWIKVYPTRNVYLTLI